MGFFPVKRGKLVYLVLMLLQDPAGMRYPACHPAVSCQKLMRHWRPNRGLNREACPCAVCKGSVIRARSTRFLHLKKNGACTNLDEVKAERRSESQVQTASQEDDSEMQIASQDDQSEVRLASLLQEPA